MNGATSLALNIRAYEERDEPHVLDLLEAALGQGPTGQRSAATFRWKHLDNPFGRSLMLVAEADGRIIGFRAFMRWEFRTRTGTIRAVRPVDTATHPAYQGRGVFSSLTREALREVSGQADLIYNTPNSKSLPGYRKLGWQTVGQVPISVRVRHPIRFARRIRGDHGVSDPSRPHVRAEPAADVLSEVGAIADVGELQDVRLRTPRSLAFMRWRYGSAPGLDYRAVLEERGTRLPGLAVFRVRLRGGLWESTVSDVMTPHGDSRTARRLLRRAARSADVDHLTCSFPTGTAAGRAALPAGFVRAPRGMTLVVKTLRPDIEPDPRALSSWGLCLGDLEVF